METKPSGSSLSSRFLVVTCCDGYVSTDYRVVGEVEFGPRRRLRIRGPSGLVRTVEQGDWGWTDLVTGDMFLVEEVRS